MKQTAVEWLISKIERNENPSLTQKEVIEYIEQAKQIEKQQIIDAYWEGCSNWDSEKEAEQYYNDKFNK